MARRAALRASDLDRERVAEHLRLATASGRLEADELEDRLGAALSARTTRQLNDVLSDLPLTPTEGEPMPVWATASLGVAGAVGVMAAAATAAVLFAGIAGASVAWAVIGRLLSGRGKRPANGRSPCRDAPLALASRHAQAIDPPRLRRGSRTDR